LGRYTWTVPHEERPHDLHGDRRRAGVGARFRWKRVEISVRRIAGADGDDVRSVGLVEAIV
jgi:hypothetical protein